MRSSGLLFFFFCCSFVFSNEYQLDYENSKDIMNTRRKVYEQRFSKIFVLSPYRTGSTYIYMILNYLFEDQSNKDHTDYSKKVVKTHNTPSFPLSNKSIWVVPVRHPLDSCTSIFRMPNTSIKSRKVFFYSLLEKYKQTESFVNKTPSNQVLLLRYEKFNTDFDYIIDSIEDKFEVKVTQLDKENMKNMFSKEANLKRQKEMPDFNTYDPITGLHGNHISTEKTTLKEMLNTDDYNMVIEKIENLLPTFHYSDMPE